MNLFQLGCFTLDSGAKSPWKLECDALTDEDWQALAKMVALTVGIFSSVEGVPTGGLKLAAALQDYAVIPHEDHEPAGYPHLIVDDVLTTGGSMEKLRSKWCEDNPDRVHLARYGCFGAVVFARGTCPTWIRPIFQMPGELFIKRQVE